MNKDHKNKLLPLAVLILCAVLQSGCLTIAAIIAGKAILGITDTSAFPSFETLPVNLVGNYVQEKPEALYGIFSVK